MDIFALFTKVTIFYSSFLKILPLSCVHNIDKYFYKRQAEKTMADEVVIVDGLRTPFVKAGAQFKDVHSADLAHHVFKELIYRYEWAVNEVDEVIVGNMGNPSDTANISRVIALRIGLPESISACTVQRNCASALESITSAFTRIQAGLIHTALVGGTESMSGYPLLFSDHLVRIFSDMLRSKTWLKKLKTLLKIRLKYFKPRMAIIEGLTDPFVGLSMGQTAEVLSKEFNITREDQDQFALESHQKAIKAQKRLAEEITPFITDQHWISDDIGPRADQSMEKLGKLRPYFDRKYGTVTVGNACPITDGAVALLLMSRKKAESLGVKPKAIIQSFAYAGCAPSRMGLGPVFASPIALKRAGLTLKDIDVIEINEAFSAQVLACMKAFSSNSFAKENLNLNQAVGEIDPKNINVNGGAVALGHPVGATGSRLVLTLMKEMNRRKSRYGLATLCVGGGQGGALILKAVS